MTPDSLARKHLNGVPAVGVAFSSDGRELVALNEGGPSVRGESPTSVSSVAHSYASQAVATTWNVMVRLHVFELRGGGVARHVVRYAAAAGHRDAYAKALQHAVREIHFVTVNYFRP